jgi:hypothetical protein
MNDTEVLAAGNPVVALHTLEQIPYAQVSGARIVGEAHVQCLELGGAEAEEWRREAYFWNGGVNLAALPAVA